MQPLCNHNIVIEGGNIEMKTKHFRINEEDWEKFKKLSHESGSNASVEIRKFIKEYIKQKSYEDTFNEVYNDHKEVLDALAEE